MADLIVRTGLPRKLSVKTHTKRTRTSQSVSDLPLFSWRVTILQPSSPAGMFVSRRYRVHPAFADLIANLAGLGSEVRQ
ncbi:hypothetical protein [Bradyrhizobium sp. WSM4349]|uniref:hypothetical protein n=1 Tax=Bradyrhizobium sp. WSM4349 TaxID=1040988 RepID=UPI0012F9E654|nr:hypothetical protein [Bradyrhizobium sp. WSM4349]